MSDKRWFEDWEKRPYERFMPALCNKKWARDLDPIVIWHDAAGVFGNAQILYDFATKQTTKPVCLWYADPITTSLAYDYKDKQKRFDAVRRTDSAGKPIVARKGYKVKLMTLPCDVISYGCRSSMGVSNFAGRLVIQIEDMMFSRDAGNLTEDEIYNRGLVQKSIGLGIMRFLDRDWVPRAYIAEGLPYPRSAGQKNGQRIKRGKLKKGQINNATVLQHSVMPWPNDHGDCGSKNLGKICEIARHELDQPSEEAAGAPSMHTQADLISSATAPAASPPVVTVPVAVDPGKATYTVSASIRPQQQGQAKHHIENAARELSIASKLLTPKKKEKSK